MKPFKKILFCFFIFSSFIFEAQQSKIDSLKIEFIKEPTDSTKAEILAKIGVTAYYINLDLAKKHNDTLIEFSRNKSAKFLAQGYRMRGTFYLLEGDFENSLNNYEKSINILKSIGKNKSISDLYGNIATLYGRNNNDEKSIEYYKKAISLNDSINYQEGNYNSYLNLAITKRRNNNYIEVSHYLNKALEIADKYNLDNKSHVHNELAGNYLELKSYDKAEFHINKAIEIAIKKQNTMALERAYGALGYLYEYRDNDFKKALLNYKKSLDYSRQMNNKSSIINSLYNVGYQYLCLGNNTEAEEHFLEGLNMSNEINNNFYKTSGYFHLANFYALQNKPQNAKSYLKKGNEMIKNRSKIPHTNIFGLLGESFFKIGDYKEAYKNIEIYANLTDSLYQMDGIGKIAEMESKYQAERKEKENLQLKADNIEQKFLRQKANTYNWLFAFGLFATLIIAFFIWKKYQTEAKAKRIITQQKDDILDQKNIIEDLQKELHHRVKNNLAIIDTFIEVAKEEFIDDSFNIKLTELQNRISSINEIHKQLYQSSDVTNLNIKKYIDVLSKNVEKSFEKKDISIHSTIENINLNADTSFPVGLIINEFLTNSYKYAFDNKGIINIEMKDQGENYILALSDNGKGLPDNFDIEQIETFGLRIVKLLTKQINGIFNLESNNGVQLTIHIPKV